MVCKQNSNTKEVFYDFCNLQKKHSTKQFYGGNGVYYIKGV